MYCCILQVFILHINYQTEGFISSFSFKDLSVWRKKEAAKMQPLSHLLFKFYCGFVIVFICNVTAVCASILPFIEAPVCMLIPVAPKIIPSK